LVTLLLNKKDTVLRTNNINLNNAVSNKTIVTRELGRKISHSFGITMEDTLTGFKYISEKINEYEASDEKTFVFRYEESFGYLLEDFARDKDAIQAAVAVSEMAQMYKDSGETLIDTLHSLYETHGYHQENIISIKLDPETGTDEVNKLINQFMNPTEEIIANLNILSVENYLTGEKIISNGESVPLTLPKENVVKYRLTNESWIAFRPSGTEPKMKIYLGVCADTEKLANEQLTHLEEQINELI